MGQPVARVGDIGVGVCPVHGPYVTVFVTGDSVLTELDGRPACHIGTIGVASCGHPTIAATGSPMTEFENGMAHRVGDMGFCAAGGPYVVATGSPTLDSD
jgi:uncharacterized Zn-binding protein involved in type VI secretion